MLIALNVANFFQTNLASNVIYARRRFSGVGTAILGLQRGQRMADKHWHSKALVRKLNLAGFFRKSHF